MEKKDRTITISSHLYFASSLSLLGCFNVAAPGNNPSVQLMYGGRVHVLVIRTVIETTHERCNRINMDGVLCS